MQTVTSISGGRSSAYCATNYPTDHNVFSLVRTSDKSCLYPDKKLRAIVEDRIQMPFVGTLEDDLIIHTILDLEQFLGRKIEWVSGITFDEVVDTKGTYLPNKFRRYCTTHLKIAPIFEWWFENFNEPVDMHIGYRSDEGRRIQKKLDACNRNGFLEYRTTFEKHTKGRHKGQNKWVSMEWQRPVFPMAIDLVIKPVVNSFWEGKAVRFAPLNNCVGCFHRNPMLLGMMFVDHPQKMGWFESQEIKKRGIRNDATWRSDVNYSDIRSHSKKGFYQLLDHSDFSECDSGYCGL